MNDPMTIMQQELKKLDVKHCELLQLNALLLLLLEMDPNDREANKEFEEVVFHICSHLTVRVYDNWPYLKKSLKHDNGTCFCSNAMAWALGDHFPERAKMLKKKELMPLKQILGSTVEMLCNVASLERVEDLERRFEEHRLQEA